MTPGKKGRSYQLVPCSIWDDDVFMNLSDTSKTVFLYLLTTIHSNILGIYVLKEGYALSDLRSVDAKKYRAAINEIALSGLIDYDAVSNVVLLKKYHLFENPILNQNQIIAIKFILGSLPKTNLLYALKNVIGDPIVLSRGKNVDALAEVERLFPGDLLHEDSARGASGEPGLSSSPPPDKEKHKKDAQALVDSWNSICGDILARASEITRNRMIHIKARLRERSLEEWERVFRKISLSSFLTGHGKEGWAASFDWIISSYDNSVKVLEGKYDDRNGSSGPRGMDALRDFSEKTEERREEHGSGEEIPLPSEETSLNPNEDAAP